MDPAGITELLSSLRPAGPRPTESNAVNGTSSPGSFAAHVSETIAQTNQSLNEAESAARQLAEGKGDIVESMIALGKADVSLRLVVNMRNKMLEGYKEIMRLQV